MTMILKFKQTETKKGVKQDVTQEDIQDLDDKYQEMIYEKEENQIQQESDLLAKTEEIKKIEAIIAALEKHYIQV